MKAGFYKTWLASGAKPVVSIAIGSRVLMGFRDTEVDYSSAALGFKLAVNAAENANLTAEYLKPRGYNDTDNVFGCVEPLAMTTDGIEANGCYVPINQASMAAVNGWTWPAYGADKALPWIEAELLGVCSIPSVMAYKDSTDLVAAVPGAMVIVVKTGANTLVTRYVIPLAKLRNNGALGALIKSVNKLTNNGPGGQMATASWPTLQDAYTASAIVMKLSVSGGWWTLNLTSQFGQNTRFGQSLSPDTLVSPCTVAQLGALEPNFYGFDGFGRKCVRGMVGIPQSFAPMITSKGVGITFSGTPLAGYYSTVTTQNTRELTTSDNQVIANLRKMRRATLLYLKDVVSGPADVWASHPWTSDFSSERDFLDTRLSDDTTVTFRQARARIAGVKNRRVLSTNCVVTQSQPVGYKYVGPNRLLFFNHDASNVYISISEALGARARGAPISSLSTRGNLDTDEAVTSVQRAVMVAKIDQFNSTIGNSAALGFLADGMAGLNTVAEPTAALWAGSECTTEMGRLSDAMLNMLMYQMTPFSTGDLVAIPAPEHGVRVNGTNMLFN